MHFQAGSRLEILAPYTVRFRFPEPDGAALVKLNTASSAPKTLVNRTRVIAASIFLLPT